MNDVFKKLRDTEYENDVCRERKKFDFEASKSDQFVLLWYLLELQYSVLLLLRSDDEVVVVTMMRRNTWASERQHREP